MGLLKQNIPHSMDPLEMLGGCVLDIIEYCVSSGMLATYISDFLSEVLGSSGVFSYTISAGTINLQITDNDNSKKTISRVTKMGFNFIKLQRLHRIWQNIAQSTNSEEQESFQDVKVVCDKKSQDANSEICSNLHAQNPNISNDNMKNDDTDTRSFYSAQGSQNSKDINEAGLEEDAPETSVGFLDTDEGKELKRRLTKLSQSIKSIESKKSLLNSYTDNNRHLKIFKEFVGFFFASTCAAPVFCNSLLDIGISMVVGAIQAASVVLGCYYPIYGQFEIFSSAFVCAFITFLFAMLFEGVNFWSIIITATIWNLPGFPIILGLLDLGEAFGPSKGSIGSLRITKAVIDGFVMAFCFYGAYLLSRYLKPSISPFGVSHPGKYKTAMIVVATSVFLALAALIIMTEMLLQTFITAFILGILFISMSFFGSSIPPVFKDYFLALICGMLAHTFGYLFDLHPEPFMLIGMLPLSPGFLFVKALYQLLEMIVSSLPLLVRINQSSNDLELQTLRTDVNLTAKVLEAVLSLGSIPFVAIVISYGLLSAKAIADLSIVCSLLQKPRHFIRKLLRSLKNKD